MLNRPNYLIFTLYKVNEYMFIITIHLSFILILQQLIKKPFFVEIILSKFVFNSGDKKRAAGLK